MQTPPIPSNETERLQALQRYQILDTLQEEAFDRLTRLAAYICETPIALVSLVDQNRQWFKSKVGIDATEMPRDLAFCAHAICQPNDLLVIPDATEDERFVANPLVATDNGIRFYAGTPLVTSDGYALGTLCAIDRQPRNLSTEQLEALRTLGQQVIAQFELRLQLNYIQQAQSQLVQSEKMSALGQLVAGVAHEINNPVNFIHGNLRYLSDYTQKLITVIEAYEQQYPNPPEELQDLCEDMELDFIAEDVQKLLTSTQTGSTRIKEIVLSLRNFSRLDEVNIKQVNIHEGIDSTLVILQHRIKASSDRPGISVLCDYSQLPLIDCYPGPLNQVFMNLLTNAMDALEMDQKDCKEQKTLRIWTDLIGDDWIAIHIADNGMGIPEDLKRRIFDPFFTTKSVGHGTGLGLSISHQIITQQHGGKLFCHSEAGKGTEFVIELPIRAQES